MKTYYSFVYLDDNIIDGLYSQLFGDAVEICTMKEDTTNIDASIKSNLMNIIKSTILGQSKTSISEQEKMVISTSKKAQLLINHLKKEEISIQEIISHNQPFNESIYFVGKAYFVISDIYDEKTGLSLFSNRLEDELRYIGNNAFVIVLENGNTKFIKQNCLDDKKNKDYLYGIMLHMSSSKMKKNIRHLTWRVERSKGFDFYIFGELIKCSEVYYKICPFAIWC